MSHMIDGHEIETLPNGGATVTTDGVKTQHLDERSALRHVTRMATERAAYEARRTMEEGR